MIFAFRYTPANQGVAFNSGAKQRIIRMVEVQKDPMEPPRFKWVVAFLCCVYFLFNFSQIILQKLLITE